MLQVKALEKAKSFPPERSLVFRGTIKPSPDRVGGHPHFLHYYSGECSLGYSPRFLLCALRESGHQLPEAKPPREPKGDATFRVKQSLETKAPGKTGFPSIPQADLLLSPLENSLTKWSCNSPPTWEMV